MVYLISSLLLNSMLITQTRDIVALLFLSANTTFIHNAALSLLEIIAKKGEQPLVNKFMTLIYLRNMAEDVGVDPNAVPRRTTRFQGGVAGRCNSSPIRWRHLWGTIPGPTA